VIRNLDKNEFDFLVAVLLNRDWSILDVYKIPRPVISKYAKYNEHQHGHILRMTGRIVTDPEIDRISEKIKPVWTKNETVRSLSSR